VKGLRWLRPGRRVPMDPDEGALWWATLRQSDPARFKAEQAAFEAWLDVPAHAGAWARIDRRIAQVGRFASMPELRDLRRAALEAARRPHMPSGYRWLGAGLLAASVALLAVWIAAPPARLGIPAVASGTAESAPQRYSTQVGERREVLLKDGSRITLNTASVIEVRYTAARRDVHLLDGQALFHVAKEIHRPFVVSAGDRIITAVGTTFDVKLGRNGGVDVMLVEGRVDVDAVRPVGWARLVPALGRERLVAGRHLQVSPGGDVSVAVRDGERATAWDRGLLIFRGERIADAVAEINRYAQVPLLVEDARILDLEVSGVFPTAGSEDFVAALEAFYPIEARRGVGVTTLRWRQAGGVARTDPVTGDEAAVR